MGALCAGVECLETGSGVVRAAAEALSSSDGASSIAALKTPREGVAAVCMLGACCRGTLERGERGARLALV